MTVERICKLVRFPGLTDYGAALQLQRRLAQERIEGSRDHDLLLLLEHPPVITLGRGSHAANVVASRALLEGRGVEVHEIERGGDVTYHGPGQLVGYPIIHLDRHKRDLHWYLRQLEEALIRALDEYGISGGRVEGYTGVWVGDRKIASIGVHVSRWVTWHGFALNVTTDLSDFALIVPCGIEAVTMTSIEKEAGGQPAVAEAAERVGRHFAELFDLEIEHATPDELL